MNKYDPVECFQKDMIDTVLLQRAVQTPLEAKWCNTASSSRQQFPFCFQRSVCQNRWAASLKHSRTGANLLAPSAAIREKGAKVALFFKKYLTVWLKVCFFPFTVHPTTKQQVSFTTEDHPLPSG